MIVIYRHLFALVFLVLALASTIVIAEPSSKAPSSTWSRADFNALTLACVETAVEQSNAAIISGLGSQISQAGLESLLLINREHLLRSCQCLTSRITGQFSPSDAGRQSDKVIELSTKLSEPGAACATDAAEILAQARRRYESATTSGRAER